MLLTLATLISFTSGSLPPGDVITAYDASAGSIVAMAASDGTGRANVSCGGDLTHQGTPRFFAHLEPTGATLSDGSPAHALVAYDDDCALGLVLLNDPTLRYTVVRWSPDGARLAFSGSQLGPSGSAIFRGIWVADVVYSGGRPSGLSNLQRAISTPNDSIVFSWSGDSRRVAFSMQMGGSGSQWDVLVADLDKGVVTNVTNTPNDSEHGGTFSPAADVVAFTRQTAVKGAVRTDVFTRNLTTGKTFQVTAKKNTSSGVNLHPTFSPDGNHIAYSGLPNGMGSNREIFRQRADGSGKAQSLTAGAGHDFFVPAWRR